MRKIGRGFAVHFLAAIQKSSVQSETILLTATKPLAGIFFLIATLAH